ncbi:GNAT family N-acetyltransferase [Kordia sp. YSTF-M3]|uniref:GNAT family N-acetyltransferase n=1 Tax=Kordia aestuariivivens TaxID=2759037 RepID=A0ABR7Q4K2_9FLAO|nr:GNAT family N-acetyltransferase [Kordia aestuariivivens]MBC8753491.1 GNAT family N-acetyltransferase [Kordia aestuariivivens]
MQITFKLLKGSAAEIILPYLDIMNQQKVPMDLLKARFAEMLTQHYEAFGIYDNDQLIGCFGLWSMTRHYCGKSFEPDHVYIEEAYRSKGIGKQLFEWIEVYGKEKGVTTIELNTYVQNFPSHKFYYNQGFNALGYHFLKKI